MGPGSEPPWPGRGAIHGRELTPGLIKAAFAHFPGKIAETGVNALILDTAYRLIEIVPMRLRLPYVQIWNVLHFDFSGSTPLALYSWPHETSPEALARNVAGLEIVREIRGPIMPIVQSYAERNGLKVDWSKPAATVSKLAVITQTPKEFDFSIPHLPPQFHYAGPFHDIEGREPISFPWEKLTGKPLIYASMGTLVNGLNKVYGAILEAVGEFPEMQVVLSVGRNVSPADLGPIPSNTIVVRVAPQIELLKRAALCIGGWLLDEATQLRACLPGRMEGFELPVSGDITGPRNRKSIPVILDGAHVPFNLAAVLRDLRRIPELAGFFAVVFGAGRDKQAFAMLDLLKRNRVDAVLCTKAASDVRAWTSHELGHFAEELGLATQDIPEPRAALMRAFALVAGRGWILVTGSLRLVGEIRSIIRELGAEPRRFSSAEKGSNRR